MSGRYSMLVAVLGGSLGLGAWSLPAWLPEHVQPKEPQPALDASKTDGEGAPDANGRSSDAPREPETAQASKPTYDQGIEADQRMANAADRMVWLTVAQVILTIGGTALLFVTLRQTRNAIRQDDSQSRRELRAYIGLDNIAFILTSPAPWDNSMNFRGTIKAVLKNYGQTPASEVCYVCNIFYNTDEFDLPDTPSAKQMNDPMPPSIPGARPYILSLARGYLNAGQTFPLDSTVDAPEVLQQVSDGKVFLFIAGRIYYRDAFNEPWSTKFCFRWAPDGGENGSFLPYKQGNGEDKAEPPAWLTWEGWPTS